MTIEKKLVCPHCDGCFPFFFTVKKRRFFVECDHCHKEFMILLGKVRSKKSRGNKKLGVREFDVRLILISGDEKFLEFDVAHYLDIELKQGDEVCFTFAGNRLRAVHNYTLKLNYYLKLIE